MTEDVFEYSAAKMRKHGMTDMAIAQFRRLYEVWRNEEASSWIREDEVEPLVSVPSFHDVYETINHDKAVDAFAKTAFLKLNGGLGTSMGLDCAKSLLPVRRHKARQMRFIDIIIGQVLTARTRLGVDLPLTLMNSFRTSKDTMKVPQKEGAKTTYNVGVIEGGTSVNTIAQEASMLCEYRSNDRECLETMRVFFEKTLEAYRAMGVEVEVELVGDRPCGGDVPQEKLDALIARADSAVRELFDAEPIHGPSSTDANIPLAAGIPAICVSAAVGRGCHTRQEEIDLDQLPNGAKLSMRLMQEYFEI